MTPAILRRLKKIGLRLAIDDFGTGYCNLSYLKHFAVDKLKIDRSFIKDVPVDAHDAAITAAIVTVAKTLHLTTVAEGVENDSQMSFLQDCSCDQIQGFLLARPMPAEEATDLLLRHSLAPLAEHSSNPAHEEFLPADELSFGSRLS